MNQVEVITKEQEQQENRSNIKSALICVSLGLAAYQILNALGV